MKLSRSFKQIVRDDYGPDFPRAAWRRNQVRFIMTYAGKIDGDWVYVSKIYRQPWKKAR